MTLENIYFIGQTISVVAILASLIFVGMQVQQAKKQTEQANNLARAQLTATTWLGGGNFQHSWVATEESAAFLARAVLSNEPLTTAEKMRFNIQMVSAVSAVELSYMLKQQALFDERLFERNLISIGAYIASPRTQKWWQYVGRKYFTPPFQDVIDDLVKQAQSDTVESQEMTTDEVGEKVNPKD